MLTGISIALTLTASIFAKALICRVSSRPAPVGEVATAADPVAEAVATARKHQKRVARPEIVAERVIAEIRAHGLNGYPVLPFDLDQMIACWCERNGCDLVCANVVREIIAAQPGVTKTRPWLNDRKHAHRYVRGRQVARSNSLRLRADKARANGDEATARDLESQAVALINDRPTLYWVADLEDMTDEPEVRRTETNSRPTPVRTGRTSGRTGNGQGMDTRPSEAFPSQVAA